jgi:alpha-L-fucosidase
MKNNEKFIIILSSVTIICLLLWLSACKKRVSHNNEIKAISKEERLKWFKEAKFGMFIHWGLYSKLAGEWNDKKISVGENAEWIMQKLKIPVEEYRIMARQFNPIEFNAEDWVKLAKNAGIKYLVITAKHHDGFAMYHSKVSEYNIVDTTPFKRDPMKELTTACQKEGIIFCFYYSHKEDWDHPDAYGNNWDYDETQKNFEKYLEEKSKPQLREILTGYGPLGLIWFDRGIYTQKQGEEFVTIVRQLQPQCLINGRVGNYDMELLGDYQNMNDNGMPIGGIEEYWETPQTLNETWGYSKFDRKWKSPKEVIHRLVEIVGKGGNYLLNVGPTGEGVIPQASVDILNKVGDWMKQNSESIYGTTSSPFYKLPWGHCTVKGEKLYMHVFNWPSDGKLKISNLKNNVKNAYLLVNKNRKLKIKQEGNTVFVAVPERPPDEVNTVVVIEIEGTPNVEPVVVEQQKNGIVNLEYIEAITRGKTVKRFNRKGGFHISKWTNPEDTIIWHFNITKPGLFEMKITYSAIEEWQGREYIVSIGPILLTSRVENTGDWYEYKTFKIGTINLQDSGKYIIMIKPKSSSKNYLMYFKSIQLIPVG